MFQVINVVSVGFRRLEFNLINEYSTYEQACEACKDWQTKGYEREPFILEREEQL